MARRRGGRQPPGEGRRGRACGRTEKVGTHRCLSDAVVPSVNLADEGRVRAEAKGERALDVCEDGLCVTAEDVRSCVEKCE